MAETSRYLALAKPASMHCAGPSGGPGPESGGETLVAWAFARFPELASVTGRGKGEGGLIHRLDSDTAGLVLFARDQEAWLSIQEAAARGAFVKSYWALGLPGDGGLSGSRPHLRAPDGTEPGAWAALLRRRDLDGLAHALRGSAIAGRFRPYGPGAARVACAMAEDPAAQRGAGGSGKAWTAETYRSEVEAAEARAPGILAEVRLSRGFRHQVRAHFAWLGLSLAGDALYGDGGPGGLALRAFRLSFPDPDGGAPVVLSLPACQYY